MKVQVYTDGERGTKGLQKKFRNLALKGGDRRNLLGRIGIQVLNEVSANFDAQGNEGKPWVPLRAATLERRRKGRGKGGGRILEDTGALRRSFVMAANEREVKVGTPTIYAPPHEFGFKHIPQRKMLPEQKRGLQLGIDTAEKFIAQRRSKIGL